MFVVLDLETTGTNAFSDHIIEIAILKVKKDNFEIIDSFSSFVNPGIMIPELITEITSIGDDDVKYKPKIADLRAKIIDFVGDLPILGQNIKFDLDFLKQNNIDLSSHIIFDTMYLANFILYGQKSLSLENLALFFNIDFSGSHRSINDVKITLEVFKKLIEELKKFSDQKNQLLEYIFSRTNDKGLYFIFETYAKKTKNKIDKTKFLKYILKNIKIINKNKIFEVDKKVKVDNIMSTLKTLEVRENQKKMLDIVDITLTENKLSIIEAPTGLGKTFAYLIPSIVYSINNKEQVFISTTTKTLQDQIFYKDLDFLLENLGLDFSYSKLKGKSNYFSIFSFIRFFEQDDYFSLSKASFLLKIIFWIKKTQSFELDELDYFGEEYSFLRNINADNRFIFSTTNSFYKNEPIIIARNNAKNSNIVIINNSILFQDIDNENSLLGKIKNLVLYEAHNLEDVVLDSLKKGFYKSDVEKNLNNIIFALKKEKYSGVEKIENQIEKLLFNLNFLFDLFEQYLLFHINTNEKYQNILLENDFFKIDNKDIDIFKLTKSLKNNFLSTIDSLQILPEDLYGELSKEIIFIDSILDIVDKVLNKEKTNLIKIISKTNKGIKIEYTFLNIGNYLYKNLWQKLDSCILTSATLSIGNSFNYLKNILSLKDFGEFILESDFNYKRQALLYLPDDLGNIKYNTFEIVEFLKDFILIVRSQTLILFRALSLIKEVYVDLKRSLKNENINIYAQGVGGSKHKLLTFYKKNYRNSIIMGSDTFWEGIDLQKEELKYLVIHKIPFDAPNNPIFKARSKLFGNSFSDYSIPKAIIRLKQGFGRLIRTKQDSGLIVFLDNRVFDTSWGSLILEAFPKEINLKKGTSQSLLNILRIKNNKK